MINQDDIEKLSKDFCKETYKNPTNMDKVIILNAMLKASNFTIESILRNYTIESILRPNNTITKG